MTQSITRCYQLLGVQEGSDYATVRAAYKRLALAYHPDRNPDADLIFGQMSAAYKALALHLKEVPEEGLAESALLTNMDHNKPDRRRYTRRGKPSDRRFEIISEDQYLGTSVKLHT